MITRWIAAKHIAKTIEKLSDMPRKFKEGGGNTYGIYISKDTENVSVTNTTIRMDSFFPVDEALWRAQLDVIRELARLL